MAIVFVGIQSSSIISLPGIQVSWIVHFVCLDMELMQTTYSFFWIPRLQMCQTMAIATIGGQSSSIISILRILVSPIPELLSSMLHSCFVEELLEKELRIYVV